MADFFGESEKGDDRNAVAAAAVGA